MHRIYAILAQETSCISLFASFFQTDDSTQNYPSGSTPHTGEEKEESGLK